jgi:hypothetical protein
LYELQTQNNIYDQTYGEKTNTSRDTSNPSSESTDPNGKTALVPSNANGEDKDDEDNELIEEEDGWIDEDDDDDEDEIGDISEEEEERERLRRVALEICRLRKQKMQIKRTALLMSLMNKPFQQ